MLGTLLLVEVDHIRWNLEALLCPSSQGIDLAPAGQMAVLVDVVVSELHTRT